MIKEEKKELVYNINLLSECMTELHVIKAISLKGMGVGTAFQVYSIPNEDFPQIILVFLHSSNVTV